MGFFLLLAVVTGQKVVRLRSREMKGVPRELGVLLSFEVELIELLHEQQVGDLFDCRERIGDAAGPEAVPEFIDEGF